MLGQRKARWCGPLALLLGPLGCGGEKFTAPEGDASGGTTSSGGTSAGAAPSGGSSTGVAGGVDAGGDSGSAGASDAAGAGGAGGSTPATCQCDDGEYCRDGSADCFPCAKLNRLQFTTPQRISTLADVDGARFPREGLAKANLLYLATGTGIRYTSDASTSAGSLIDTTSKDDSGPLLLAKPLLSSDAMISVNFAFDRVREGRRSIWLGTWKDGLLTSEPAPSPFNADKDDYSIAIAGEPGSTGARLFWMTTRGAAMGSAPASLVTALTAADAVVATVDLKIGQQACSPSDQDLTPWVTRDGTTLLTSHTRLDASCKSSGQGKDLYTALLQPTTGQPTAAALPMNDVNSPMNDVDPSFSADLCDLYFASDRDGKYALYRAHRR
jgi:hypothetical protein